MLELQHLDAWRDDRCLYRDLTVTLPAGAVLQVAGVNGAGKTTLLHTVAGLRAPDAGRVCWRGIDRRDDPEAMQRDLLFLGHLPGLKASLSVQENLRFLAACRGLRLPAALLDRALERVGLAGCEDAPVAQLSAGQRRRVALARLFTEPVPLWVLDEPFTAIDRDGVAAIETWVADHAEAGGSVLLTTHHALSLRCPLAQLTLQRRVDDDMLADDDSADDDGALP